LLGGFGGAAIAHAGKWSDVLYTTKVVATVEFIVIAPMIGLALGLTFVFALMWTFRKASPIKVDRWFRVAQLGSAAAYSLGHGTNDAQKTMGIIAGALFAGGYMKTFYIPTWVILAAHAAIALGTFTGGWRIVKTMGSRLTKLKPMGGFCAETAGAITILTAAYFGGLVSTTHTITGAIVGVGTIHRVRAVRWGLATSIVYAWVFTIPAAAAMAALAYWAIRVILPASV